MTLFMRTQLLRSALPQAVLAMTLTCMLAACSGGGGGNGAEAGYGRGCRGLISHSDSKVRFVAAISQSRFRAQSRTRMGFRGYKPSIGNFGIAVYLQEQNVQSP